MPATGGRFAGNGRGGTLNAAVAVALASPSDRVASSTYSPGKSGMKEAWRAAVEPLGEMAALSAVLPGGTVTNRHVTVSVSSGSASLPKARRVAGEPAMTGPVAKAV
ncbi:MAG: hypothetical protein FD129_2495, partial [bacterium]